MTHRILPTAMVLSLSLLALPATRAASQAFAAPNTVATTGKVKLVSFSIRNSSPVPLTVKAGDQQIIIAPGKTASMRVQRGLQVTTVNDTAHLSAGAVLTTVTDYLQGNTIAVS